MQEGFELQTALWIYDIDVHRITWTNQSGLKWWESSSIEELSSRDFSIGSSDALLSTLKAYQKAFYDNKAYTELWHFTPKGISKKALCRYSGIKTHDNRMAMLVEATPADIFSPIIHDQAVAIIATIDFEGNLLSCNPPFEEEFGALNKDLTQLLIDQVHVSTLINTILHNVNYEVDLHLKTLKDRAWFRAQFSLVGEHKSKETILCQLHNIDERKKREIALTHQANNDALTGLLNRRGFNLELNKLLDANRPIDLLYIDLDGFKMINDSMGHNEGDIVLIEVARRIKALNIDHVISCRFGGDEFLLAFPKQTKRTEDIAADAVTLLSEPYQNTSGGLLSLSASIGISSSSDNPTTNQSKENQSHQKSMISSSELIRFADVAMYVSKAAGKKRWTKFVQGMEYAPLRKSIVSQQLSKAIENNELSLHYQPIVNVMNNSIHSFEALLRWNNPKLGQVSPQELIEVAENIGLINDIENWVILTAISDLAKLRRYTKSTATISVNVSSMHIVDKSLPDYLLSCLDKHGLLPSDLVIEITESTLLDGLNQIDNPLNSIIERGVALSIDDFGTGYSSLAYLHKIKAETVKIDQAFADLNDNSIATLNAIHHLIESLSMNSLIEGIETASQALLAKKAGICLHQGYYYAKPAALTPENFKPRA